MCVLCACVCICVLAEAPLSFYAANPNADLICVWSSASRLLWTTVSLVARSGWLVSRQLFDGLAMVSAPSTSWGLCCRLLAGALRRYFDVILD